jgi:PncC family amidohydrolase
MQEQAIEISHQVHEFFIGSGLTLSAAESCTGGLVSSCITDTEGASNFFKGSVVCYWTEAKIDILDVSPETIRLHGAVSAQTALEMAERVRLLFGTDYSISTTGNLGPTAIEGKQTGLVFIAVSKNGELKYRRLLLTGSRIENKVKSALEALKFLIEG